MLALRTFISHTLLWVLPLLGVRMMWRPFLDTGLELVRQEIRTSRTLPNSTPSPIPPILSPATGGVPGSRFLRLMVAMYWVMAEHESLPLSLQALLVFGGIGAQYSLFVMEASRRWPLSRVLFRVALFGLMMMVVTQALVTPLYCAFDLLSTRPRRRPVHPSATYLPQALGLGYYLIIVVASLPSPSVLSHSAKRIIISTFPAWGVWVSGFLAVMAHASHGLGVSPLAAPRAHSHTAIYLFALAVTAIPYLAVVLISILPGAACGVVCRDDHLTLARVFVPRAPWGVTWGTKMPVQEALLSVLQWDYILAGLSVLLWAIAVRLDRFPGRSAWKLLGTAIGLSVLLSPMGAATLLLW